MPTVSLHVHERIDPRTIVEAVRRQNGSAAPQAIQLSLFDAPTQNLYQGVIRKYRPDFLIRLTNGQMLVLETKGQDSQQDRTKREFLAEWVKAVNQHGGFGRWGWAVSHHPDDVAGILEEATRSSVKPEEK